jgi:hypothetical protein
VRGASLFFPLANNTVAGGDSGKIFEKILKIFFMRRFFAVFTMKDLRFRFCGKTKRKRGRAAAVRRSKRKKARRNVIVQPGIKICVFTDCLTGVLIRRAADKA